ncbi:MAG: RHS repeat-associated core domain-containing protein [Anaerolineae bacterium]
MTTTHNLFGLDPSAGSGQALIQQDDGTTTRTLLADGLGSVRTEMVDGAVETVTTYEPYGNLLAQTGTSGTTYGFTGEQHDAATGLLYLRARYFNPAIQLFMTRDAWQGDMYRPMSYNPWLYVYANPVNWTDPSGLLTCEAPQAGCEQWVQNALNAIESVPFSIGKQLVQSLWAKDRTIQGIQFFIAGAAGVAGSDNSCSSYLKPIDSAEMPGFKIKFTNDFPWGTFDALTTPWAIYLRPNFLTNPESGPGTLLLAHELVHVNQGSSLAFSILGEVLAYRTTSTLRPYLDGGSLRTKAEIDADKINLSNTALRYDYSLWLQMYNQLIWWEQNHPKYKPDPILPLEGNPFPPPKAPYRPSLPSPPPPDMPPHGHLPLQ